MGRKRKVGRPRGSYKYNKEKIEQVKNFICKCLREHGQCCRGDVQRAFGWNWRTTNKYVWEVIKALGDSVIPVQIGRIVIFFSRDFMERELGEYYESIFRNK
ncbi:hypothetical protein DRP04_15425 [Archaeoglobales archaeon]|nr:MAG: hypothetical protein DRP04_15425 [Archaeoglobales archaeon]